MTNQSAINGATAAGSNALTRAAGGTSPCHLFRRGGSLREAFWNTLRCLVIPLILVGGNAIATEPRVVAAAVKPDGEWKSYPTRILADLPEVVRQPADTDLSHFGGWRIQPQRATGFFRTVKLNGRWWLVDPDGHLFLHKGVASVRPTETPGAIAALNERFGSMSNWAAQTTALLREHGFNGLGGWSNPDALRPGAPPLVYTRMWNFMGTYGRQRGGTYQKPGHLGYPNDCIFVFDPEFERFCGEYARQLADTKDDPWLLGHFSDNEMPLPREALRKYVSLPENDPGHQAALKWLRGRHGPRASVQDITAQDEGDFLALIVDRYFSVVSRAIKQHDPNHLYLGARFHGADLRQPEIFRACGPHVDVVSVNYYRSWTPVRERLEMWERESGRPVLITEWYAKGVDSGLPNHGGAGWLVKTQQDRGLFYQNFALALLESRVCVGWHWFKYMDNDPDDQRADPSNRDSNKGIVSNRYEPYAPLLAAMRELNQRAYRLTDFFDGASRMPILQPAHESYDR
jgi:hypothetical protein